MPFLARSLILWLILLGTCVLIPQVMTRPSRYHPELWWLVCALFSIPFAALATVWASLRLSPRLPGRVIFWAITSGLWLIIVVLFLGGAERMNLAARMPLAGILYGALAGTPLVVQFAVFRSGVPPRHRGWFWSFFGIAWLIMALWSFGLIRLPAFPGQHEFGQEHVPYLGFQLAGIALVSLQLQRRRWPTRQTLKEAAAGLALLALIIVVAWLEGEMQLRSARRQAFAAWAEIGLPLEKFEGKAAPRAENASAALVAQLISQWADDEPRWRRVFGARVIDDGPESGAPKSPKDEESTPPDWRWHLNNLRTLPLMDEIDLRGFSLGPENEAFRAVCRQILQAEPPVFRWSKDGSSYEEILGHLGAFTQWALVHTAVCLAARDEAGAIEAMAAVQRILDGFSDTDDNFFEIGVIEHPDIQVSLVSLQAYLTRWDDGPAAIERDLLARRQRLLKVGRQDAWRELHRRWLNERLFHVPIFPALPRWLRNSREAWASWIEGAHWASQVAFALHQPTPDSRASDPSTWRHRHTLAQLDRYFLLREQADLIRTTRARLAQGLPPENRPCVVFPGATWELRFDPAAYAVAIELTGTPAEAHDQLENFPRKITWKYRRPAAPGSSR